MEGEGPSSHPEEVEAVSDKKVIGPDGSSLFENLSSRLHVCLVPCPGTMEEGTHPTRPQMHGETCEEQV